MGSRFCVVRLLIHLERVLAAHNHLAEDATLTCRGAAVRTPENLPVWLRKRMQRRLTREGGIGAFRWIILAATCPKVATEKPIGSSDAVLPVAPNVLPFRSQGVR